MKPKIKIVSDGNPWHAVVYDEAGKEIQGITRVTLDITGDQARATLQFDSVAVEAFGNLEQVDRLERAVNDDE